ncbi:type 1 glutamine amidotransferase domain-containing protein [Kytococcus sedentarius]|uniref:type 1 glutamine amidotransferase domain-containing protein n=1 Tax=Kytococcus sedentarius TaxID=1276 RepID=UPI003879589D
MTRRSAATGWTLEDGTVHPTGYWAAELTEPHRILTEAGWENVFATPGSAAPTLDEASLGIMGGTKAKREKTRVYLDSLAGELSGPLSLKEVDLDVYDLVLYPGGHGPMEDLAYDPVSGAMLRDRLTSDRPLALVCHAPAAVLAATDEQGRNAFRGLRMTGFSKLEERLNPFSWKAKWLLEDRLKEAGIRDSESLIPLKAHIVKDGTLYIGQNPASAAKLAKILVKDLGRG